MPQTGMYKMEVTIDAIAKKGSNLNIIFVSFQGMRFSLEISFMKSAKG